MIARLLLRWLGLGRLPARERPALEAEGIRYLQEGIVGSLTYRNFRAPGRRFRWRRQWFFGAFVVTRGRFAVYAFSRPLLRLDVTDARRERMRWSCDNDSRLLLTLDAADLAPDQSGTLELRLAFPAAHRIVDALSIAPS